MSAKDRAVAATLKAVCEETASQAIAATLASGEASRVHAVNAKYPSAKAAKQAKIAAAKAKREASKGYDL